jgi:hypothetical protein
MFTDGIRAMQLLCDDQIQTPQDPSLAATGRGEQFRQLRHQFKLLMKANHPPVFEHSLTGRRAQVYVAI